MNNAQFLALAGDKLFGAGKRKYPVETMGNERLGRVYCLTGEDTMDDKEYIEEENIEDLQIDPEEFEFELDDEDFEESEYTTKRSFLKKPVALLILIAFILLAFSNFSYLLSDRLDFLNQNKELIEDEIVLQSRPAVVSVEAGQRQGTGFNVSPEGTIITNEHVVADSTNIVVRFDDGRSFISHQYQVVSGVDVAIIYLSGDAARDLPVIKLSKEDQVQSGDTVTIIGNPLGFEQISQRGSVGQFYKVTGTEYPVFDIRISISPGNSGSPVLNEKAEAVGIVFASASPEGDDTQDSVALAVPIQVLPPVTPGGNTGQ